MSQRSFTAHVMPEGLTVVATFSIAAHAHLARGLLETHGIRVFIADEHLVTLDWLYSNAIGGVKLQVAESDCELARELLASAPASESSATAPGIPELKEDAAAPWGSCPQCGSSSTEFHAAKRATFLVWLLTGFPLKRPTKGIRCMNCGHRWEYGGEHVLYDNQR